MVGKSYKNLTAWQKGMELVKEIYNITNQFPKSELYILTSQMLRAGISIPSNIAEGYRRSHRPEYIQFLSISLASAAELETQIKISKGQYSNIYYIKAEKLVDEVQRLLYVTIKSLRENK